MKRLTLIIITLLASTALFAHSTISGPQHGPSQLQSLGAAFKSHSGIAPAINPNDITMGYAGEDVSRKPVISTISMA